MQNSELPIAIYSRKSKYTGKGESIGNQIELCKEYIRTHYSEEDAEKALIYEDEGFSGKTLERPDFKKMMSAAKTQGLKAIVVYRLDRISRNISDFSKLIEELSHLNIAFVSIREQFDTSTPTGRAMMYISSIFSQLERETIAERIRDNMHELAKTGRWLGGTPPTGYASEAIKSITSEGKSKKSCKLKMIPQEADIVRTIYDLYLEYDSQTVTEAELMKRGIKTKNNNYSTRFSIKAILQNPVYAIADKASFDYFRANNTDLFSSEEEFDGIHGIMAYNRTFQQKGKATIYRPIEEWIVSVGGHPGLIPGKTWIRVQESLERNKSKAYRKPRTNEALLTGLLYCSCGNHMYPKQTRQLTEDGKSIYTYVCQLKERSRRSLCSQTNICGNSLDLAVWEQVKLLSADQNCFLQFLEENRKFYAKEYGDCKEKIAALQREHTETQKKIQGLIDSLADLEDSGVKPYIIQRIGDLQQELESDTARIHELQQTLSRHSLSDTDLLRIKQSSMFITCMDEMATEEKRAVIRTLVQKVVWDGVQAHILLFGSNKDSKIPLG